MSKLEKIFQKIKAYSNGEEVARRMTQVWDFALDPDGEPLTADSVMRVIESHEEKLLMRTQLNMLHEKAILPSFRQELKECTDEEWTEFKNSHEIKPLEKADRERLFADASGLVRGTGFEDWVLGKEVETAGLEKQILVHRIIHESGKEKKA
jgi:hypothetical protein